MMEVQKQTAPKENTIAASIEAVTPAESVGGILEKIKNLAKKIGLEFGKDSEAAALSESVLRKVSEQLGSNRGGWYENQATSERHYVKFYKNPDQARTEFIANEIYAKLGIGAVRSELLEMEGSLAIASREIPGAVSTYRDEQRSSDDVRNGFVADAYLANWDVVGLVFDNVVKGNDGRLYRIDNGGSLTFRAMGGPKSFPADAVPELDTMRRPEYPAGQVFADLKDEDLKVQAERLVHTLKDADIDEIISRSGLADEQAETVRNGLKGRRRALMQRFGLTEEKKKQNPEDRIPIAIDKLMEQSKRLEGMELRPRVGLLADSQHIENQQVDIIDATDEGRYEINFKLTWQQHQKVLNKIQKRPPVTWGEIRYGRSKQKARIASAFTFEHDGMTVRVANDANIRSAFGLVQVEIPVGPETSREEIGKKAQDLFQKFLEIPGGLEPPPEKAEREYKWRRYAWLHKLDLKQQPDDWDDIESRIRREEAYPGYFTMVEPGFSKELEKISPYAIYHQVRSPGNLVRMIKAGGLAATHERYRRGLLIEGWSSNLDLEKGGADSVFTRTVTEAGWKKSNHSSTVHPVISEMPVIVFDPDLFDRTDWYAYGQDEFGKTYPETFQIRQTPRELFEQQASAGYSLGNEQMFRTGIPVEKMRAIACYDTGWREEIISLLTASGIREVNGVPISELLHRGADAVREELKKAGIDFFGEQWPEDFLRDQTRKAVIPKIRENWDEQIGPALAGKYPDLEQFLAEDPAVMEQALREAGIRDIGGFTPERYLAWYGLDTYVEVLRMNGIQEINGMPVRKVLFEKGINSSVDELKRIGITRLAGTSVDGLFRAARKDARELLRTASLRRSSDLGYPFEFDKMDEQQLLEYLASKGIQKIGGQRIDDMQMGDARDAALKQFRKAGITEINGKPIEEFVVYAKNDGDLLHV